VRSSIAIAVMGMLLAGCSVVKTPERPQWTTFVLDAPAPPAENLSSETSGGASGTDGSTESATAAKPILRVSSIMSGAGYDTPRMAYVESSGTLEYFQRHRWAESPAEMLAPVLVSALERTGRFAAVIDPSSRAVGDASLESELHVFRMEVDGGPAQFHVTLRANVVGAAERRPITAARTFDVFEPARAEDASAGAAAARAAAAKLADQVAAWCAEVAATPR
jgi:cholesterol transport system auxiliary component